MEVQVAAQTRTALKADLTLRCLLRAKFHRHMSRRSADVIPWARSLAERLSSAVIQEVGQETVGFSIQMNMVQMLGSPNIVYICYDLFLAECDKQLQSQISGSFQLKRPIHSISRKGKVYIIRRDQRVDDRVAGHYLDMGSIDKGPRPYFSDLQNPPYYDENGQRIENWREWLGKSPERSTTDEHAQCIEDEQDVVNNSLKITASEDNDAERNSEGRNQDKLAEGAT